LEKIHLILIFAPTVEFARPLKIASVQMDILEMNVKSTSAMVRILLMFVPDMEIVHFLTFVTAHKDMLEMIVN
jgi:hypothetical protein